ncbi:MAG: DUF4294 domain-containing protein [Marinifilaceae bacterium]
MFRFLLLLLAIIFTTSYNRCCAQHIQNHKQDTTYHLRLPEVTIKSTLKPSRKTERYQRRMDRLEYNVRKAYPYARLAAHKLNEINQRLNNLDKNKNKEAFLKEQYKQLMREFKAPLMKLSVNQGKILVRLIHRETHNSAFQHIRDYRGGANAYFWQTLALMFGNNLKADYNPTGDDMDIEIIVQKIIREQQW